MSAEPVRQLAGGRGRLGDAGHGRVGRRLHRDESRAVRIVMRAGLVIALLLLVAGTIIEIAAGGQADAVRYTQLFSDPSIGDRVLMLGALILALTPVVQVVALLVSWWRVRDYRYAGVAATVVAMLVVGALLGMAH